MLRLPIAAVDAASAYLDGKPTGSRVKIGRAKRDADFWSCPYWPSVPIDTWRSSVMTLALSRYFAQEDTSNPDLLERLAAACPAVLEKAARYSGIVMCLAPLRRVELELMSAFYQRDFLETYMGHMRTVGDRRVALRKLCEGGVLSGMQNRLPLTWSGHVAKIENIIGWTVTAAAPQGDAARAAAILDFWSSDWAALSSQLKASPSGLRPDCWSGPS